MFCLLCDCILLDNDGGGDDDDDSFGDDDDKCRHCQSLTQPR
jgi:hypothetical protein